MTLRATRFARGTSSQSAPVGSVVLDAEARHLRRKRIVLQSGDELLVDFEHAVQLQDGDVLLLDDGSRIGVVAAVEELTEVKGDSPEHLNRLAWHIGNRHLPAQIEDDRIVIRRDRVIAAMLMNLGARLRDVCEPFSPEHGAYHTHGH
jgi:urease accessory protein